MEILTADYLTLALAALLAGLVDAVVGGGGLIQVPALFGVFPAAAPATLFGTNKLAGIWGTLFAARSYAIKISIAWSIAIPASIAALLFSFAGAYLVTYFPPELTRKALPFLLSFVALYVAKNNDFGLVDAPRFHGLTEFWIAIAVGSGIGLYDGFFGPGTGSLLIFLFIRVFRFDFLGASALAKIVNVACNFSALSWFAYSGHLFWQLGLVMAVCNIVGAITGARLALRHGSGFVRRVFLVVVSLLILKTTKDAFWP
jgi:uncharacterized membrane protein YfcA